MGIREPSGGEGEEMIDVYAEVLAERKRQDEKWGEQNHQPFIWMNILGEEFGEVCQAALQAYFPNDGDKTLTDYRKELIETAAVAIAAIECLDRGNWMGREKENEM